jgi:hypothetical protein
VNKPLVLLLAKGDYLDKRENILLRWNIVVVENASTGGKLDLKSNSAHLTLNVYIQPVHKLVTNKRR